MSLLRSSRDTSRSVFERHARLYDRSRIVSHFLGEWDRRLADLRPRPPLLDLGCATGRMASNLVERGFDDIVGVDLSLSELRIAGGKLSGIPLMQAFIEDLPVSGEYFQTAVLSGVIHHLEDPGRALDEIFRVLRPGGHLCVSEPYFRSGMRQIVNATLEIYPFTGDRKFYSPADLFDLGNKHGFRKKEAIVHPFSFILVLERC